MKILHAIISDYLETAEPVGSRTISKNYDLGISPATIRNEMSDLEELGFIEQPHTSAGRIPSDKGYRYYVDSLVKLPDEVSSEELSNDLLASADRIESLLKQIAVMLAEETKYATFVTSPQGLQTTVKNIQLVQIDANKLLVVVVTDGNVIKNYMLDLSEDIDQVALNRLTFVLNEHLFGKTLNEITLPMIKNMQQYAGEHHEIVGKVLDVLFHTIREIDDSDVIVSGATNMLRLPEFHDVDKALELINTLEKGEATKNIVARTLESDSETVDIKIGEEIEIEEMKDCSVISTSYHIGGKKVGAIAVVGPKRMDYNKTMSTLKKLQTKVENILNNQPIKTTTKQITDG